jgi:hypothetical protein
MSKDETARSERENNRRASGISGDLARSESALRVQSTLLQSIFDAIGEGVIVYADGTRDRPRRCVGSVKAEVGVPRQYVP